MPYEKVKKERKRNGKKRFREKKEPSQIFCPSKLCILLFRSYFDLNPSSRLTDIGLILLRYRRLLRLSIELTTYANFWDIDFVILPVFNKLHSLRAQKHAQIRSLNRVV